MLAVRHLGPGCQQRKPVHGHAAAVLVRPPVEEQGLDRLDVSVAHRRQDPPPVLRDDVPGQVEGVFARQRQPAVLPPV